MNMMQSLQRFLSGKHQDDGAVSADKVARHAYRSMLKGKAVAIQGLMNWLAAFSVRFSPRALATMTARWMNQTS